jgi:hypothetical protein
MGIEPAIFRLTTPPPPRLLCRQKFPELIRVTQAVVTDIFWFSTVPKEIVRILS